MSLSFVGDQQEKFFLHERTTFEWADSWWKHVSLRFVNLLFLKEKQIHHVFRFSFLFGLTDS